MTAVRGIELSQRFCNEVVAPLLRETAPELQFSAGLVGPGSEVLGFDDDTSRDHDWGPRLFVFLESDAALSAHATSLSDMLARRLPRQFLGLSTHFSLPDPTDNGTQQRVECPAEEPVRHRVLFETLSGYTTSYLGVDIMHHPLTPFEWLAIPQQKLKTLVAVPLFVDDLGLARHLSDLAWFPPDVERVQLAALWHRLGQEEHLMGRCGLCDDDMGGRIIAARLARDLMRLCFLYERTYAPYPKWLGTAFSKLPAAQVVGPLIMDLLKADTADTRQAAYVASAIAVAGMHNRSDITPSSFLPEQSQQFFTRPIQVMQAGGFAYAIMNEVCDERVKAAVMTRSFGGIDTLTDNTYVAEDATLVQPLSRILACQDRMT